ncbi:hypothetical protein FACS189490_04630 [Clostridia bacterium]|nr:hypothetical protein FACS189490_04630 [Clostridia bacterium]
MTVRQKLIAALVCFAIIPAAIVTLAYVTTGNTLRRQVFNDRAQSVSRAGASIVSQTISNKSAAINRLVSVAGIAEFLSSQNADTQAMSELFAGYFSPHDNVFSIVLTNSEGVVIASDYPGSVGYDISSEEYYQTSASFRTANIFVGKAVDLPHRAHENEKKVTMSRSFFSDNSFLGVLAVYINSDAFGANIESVYFGETGVCAVIDADNYVIYHMDHRFVDSYTRVTRLANIFERITTSAAPQSDSFTDFLDGVEYAYTYRLIPGTQLIYLTRQEASELTRSDRPLMTNMLTVFLLSALLSGIAALSVSRLFIKPVKALTALFSAASSEESYTVSETVGKDEFGEMAKEYNSMITRLKRQFQRVNSERLKREYFACHDALTGLVNQAYVEQELSSSAYIEETYCVYHIDIAEFRRADDVFGDDTLTEAVGAYAARLMSSPAGFDICARSQEHEFLFVKKAENSKSASRLFLDTMGILLKESLEPLKTNFGEFYLSVNVGASVYPSDSTSCEGVLANAAIALRRARTDGKNAVSFYSESMRLAVNRKNAVMQTLREAIAEDLMFLLFQPVMRGDKIVAYEALARLKSKKLGLISPVEFMPVAEIDGHLMSSITEWILLRACDFTKTLSTKSGFSGFVAVNVSSAQIDDDNFTEAVRNALTKTGLEYDRLCLEISEKTADYHFEMRLKKINELRELGVAVALDDFGVGGYSMSCLFKMSPNVLKFSRRFYCPSKDDPRADIVNKSVVALARRLSIKIAAKEVETAEDLALVNALGCDYVQGFLLKHPLSEESIMNTLMPYE